MFVVLRIINISIINPSPETVLPIKGELEGASLFMEIKVLGTGCAGCKALFATVEKVVADLGINASIVKEEDIMKIKEYNVITLPAIVIDEKVVAKGKLSYEQVKELLAK